MRPDVYFCYATGGLWVLAIALYVLRMASRGAVHSERVAKIGGNALVSRGIMDATYWAIDPFVRALARLGFTPNILTLMSLAFGLGAGVALGFGWFGLACLLSSMSTLGDIFDGQVARLTNTGSAQGELLDAAVDRYTEFAFLGGVALVVRESSWQLALVLGAVLASFMVSYASAKAEALRVTPPRGLMRRHERAFFLIAGAGISPLIGPTAVAHGWPYATPMLVAVGLVAVIGNVSGVQRLVRIGRAVR
jgi:CDP-diacylglycerol--glycerol-3-phosphate 3-phosphatidyltransferase